MNMRHNKSSIIIFPLIILFFIGCHNSIAVNPPPYIHPEAETPPHVIWFHNAALSGNKSLEFISTSHIVTDVLITTGHRYDKDGAINNKIISTINILKNKNINLIWCRPLWPYYNNNDLTIDNILDPNYYINEIDILKAEGKTLGANYIALDTEPYGYSPLKIYLKHEHRQRLSGQQWQQLQDTVTYALELTRGVDFILPAGSSDCDHPYNILAQLGQYRISENTYYDKPVHECPAVTYHITGVYVSLDKSNSKTPNCPYYTISDLFQRKHLWNNRRGIFIYTSSSSSLGVAKELHSYTSRYHINLKSLCTNSNR